MGGYGSGWKRRKKLTVEDGWILSSAKLQRDRLLGANMHWLGSLMWTRTATDEKLSSIGYDPDVEAESGTVRLHYTRRSTGESIDYCVRVTTTRLPWGGLRWWFACPLIADGQECGRRVGKLYLPPGAKYFGCRHCYDLTYTSCQESHKFDACLGGVGAQFGLTAREVMKRLQERHENEQRARRRFDRFLKRKAARAGRTNVSN